jgi:hypothetical protein
MPEKVWLLIQFTAFFPNGIRLRGLNHPLKPGNTNCPFCIGFG